MAALLSVGCNSGGVAADKYHPEKICLESITPAECDLLVEKAVSVQTEFVSLKSGESLIVPGWPIYSPSRRRVLMVDGYGGTVYTLEVWRFGEARLVNEFHLESPPGEGWGTAAWNGENEVLARPILRMPATIATVNSSGRILRPDCVVKSA